MAVTSFQAIQPPYLLQATRVAIPVLDNDNNLTYSYMSSITTLRKLILQMTSSRIPLQSGESASKFDGSLHIVRSSDETILAYRKFILHSKINTRALPTTSHTPIRVVLPSWCEARATSESRALIPSSIWAISSHFYCTKSNLSMNERHPWVEL